MKNSTKRIVLDVDQLFWFRQSQFRPGWRQEGFLQDGARAMVGFTKTSGPNPGLRSDLAHSWTPLFAAADGQGVWLAKLDSGEGDWPQEGTASPFSIVSFPVETEAAA